MTRDELLKKVLTLNPSSWIEVYRKPDGSYGYEEHVDGNSRLADQSGVVCKFYAGNIRRPHAIGYATYGDALDYYLSLEGRR